MAKRSLIAGIDAGGTTFKLGVAKPDGTLLAKARVPTTTPEATVAASSEELKRLAEGCGGEIARLGVASFGPVDVDRPSRTYGTILKTPKPHWSGAPLLSMLTDELSVPGVLDTDVNAALEAEMALGHGRGFDRAAYVTVGTGVGVGVKSGGRFAGRPLHPELGHIRVERHPADGDFDGVCAFHGNCLEGLCSAPALIRRFGALEDLPETHEAWEIAGYYLAQLCLTLSLGFRLERIILGGGVLQAPSLLPSVRRHFSDIHAGYLHDIDDVGALITRAQLGDDAGLLGALCLATSQT